jgi:ActR/RegA family two-component response regulator
MRQIGRILVADDDETFLLSTADLLRREGYHCDCAPDAAVAEKLLRASRYDLLIADIRMPGNKDLEFVGRLGDIAKGMPVILVTGYPSLDTAIESIRLPVVAYLVKPVDFDELLGRVEIALQYGGAYAAVEETRSRVAEWNDDLDKIGRLMRLSRSDATPLSTNTFVDLTMTNIVGALSDIRNLTESITSRAGEPAACHLLNCPRPAALIKGLTEAVEVLEKTKRSFKSKELAELRRRLEEILKESQ